MGVLSLTPLYPPGHLPALLHLECASCSDHPGKPSSSFLHHAMLLPGRPSPHFSNLRRGPAGTSSAWCCFTCFSTLSCWGSDRRTIWCRMEKEGRRPWPEKLTLHRKGLLSTATSRAGPGGPVGKEKSSPGTEGCKPAREQGQGTAPVVQSDSLSGGRTLVGSHRTGAGSNPKGKGKGASESWVGDKSQTYRPGQPSGGQVCGLPVSKGVTPPGHSRARPLHQVYPSSHGPSARYCGRQRLHVTLTPP